MFSRRGAGIGSGKRDENVAGLVARNAAVAPEAQSHPVRKTFQLVRQQRCIGRHHHDDGTVLGESPGHEGVRFRRGDFASDRNTGDPQIVPSTVIALHEHTDRITAIFGVQAARRTTDAALIAVANHAGAAADAAFFDSPRMRAVECVHGVFRLDVKSIDVVQPAIPGFGDHWQRPIEPRRVRRGVRDAPLDHCVAHHAHAVGVGNHHRALEKSRFFDPGSSRHLAVAVLRKPRGEHWIGNGVMTARQHRRHPSAHRAMANLQFAGSRNQCRVADSDTGHVRNGIEGSGSAVEWDS